MSTSDDTMMCETACVANSPATTRRRFLAAGGAVALGSTAGCLGRIASATTSTSASPAAVMTGAVASGGAAQLRADFRSANSRAVDPSDFEIDTVPVTLRRSGVFSASIDLDGWSSDTTMKAQDYNTVRSNKRRSTFGVLPDDLDDDDDAFDDLIDDLYAYLDGEAVVGERITVCVPDARVPRGPAIVDEITPERILTLLTSDELTVEHDGGIDHDGRIYAWGKNSFTSADGDDTLVWSWGGPSAALLVPEDGGRSVAGRARGSGVTVTVQNTPPATGRGGGAGKVSVQDFRIDHTLGDWGDETESDGVSATDVVVAPALALPDDAPMPLPAVLYLRRCKHEGEYIYTGGWTIDDGALYEDSCTLLAFDGPNEVVSFTPEDVATADATRELSQRLHTNIRRHRGASLYHGDADEDLLGTLPESFRDGEGRRDLVSLIEETLAYNNRGRNPQTGKEILIPLRDGPVGGEYDTMSCVATAVDCPLVHLVDADDDEKAATFDAFLKIEGVAGESAA